MLVEPPVIEAIDDDYSGSPVNGYVGDANIGNALDNDTLNGDPADLSEITITVITPATDPGVSLDEMSGTIGVALGTPAATYTITYQICEDMNPTNCDTAIITVVVTSPAIDAVDDDYSGSPVDTLAGEPNVGNVLDNDTLNGVLTNLSETTITVVTPATDPGVSLDVMSGAVSVAPGTPVAMYTIEYQLCETLNPTNCDTAVVTVVVATPCIEIEAWVYLEGAAIDSGGTVTYNVPMRTDLNDLRVLPGQTYDDPFFGPQYSLPGQPYNVTPWSYNGQ